MKLSTIIAKIEDTTVAAASKASKATVQLARDTRDTVHELRIALRARKIARNAALDMQALEVLAAKLTPAKPAKRSTKSKRDVAEDYRNKVATGNSVRA